MQKIGDISQKEMYRAFNMGIGMVVIVNPVEALKLKKIIKDHSPIFEIGLITKGNKRIVLKQNQ